MRDAYRDDLAAAELRVSDLEREHAALVAKNTALEASASSKPATTPAPDAAPVPAVVHKPRFQMTTGESAVMFGVIAATVVVASSAHLSRDAGKALMIVVVLATQGLMRLRRQAIEPTATAEHRLAAPPAVPLTEEEANRKRLADALERERAEAAARENAARVEAEVRAIEKARPPDKADTPRSVAMIFAVVGCMTAGALGSLAGIAIVMAATGGALFVIDRRKVK